MTIKTAIELLQSGNEITARQREAIIKLLEQCVFNPLDGVKNERRRIKKNAGKIPG